MEGSAGLPGPDISAEMPRLLAVQSWGQPGLTAWGASISACARAIGQRNRAMTRGPAGRVKARAGAAANGPAELVGRRSGLAAGNELDGERQPRPGAWRVR